MFYPRNPDRLRTDVLDLLAEVAPPPKLTPKALIAPHAGYIYSGSVAAAAFATLRDSPQAIKRVVLIGPAHYVHVRGIAAPTVSSFETPVGRVPVDLEALSTLSDLKIVIWADAPHAPSTPSKWSCRSCKLCCHLFKSCRSLSATRRRTMSPMCCDGCGAVPKR
jgi:AmmeMemoRadiSam system protein B